MEENLFKNFIEITADVLLWKRYKNQYKIKHINRLLNGIAYMRCMRNYVSSQKDAAETKMVAMVASLPCMTD